MLFLGRARNALRELLFELTPSDHEIVVLAVTAPWTRCHSANIDKLPVGHIGRRETKVIANRRRNVQPGTLVQVWLRSLVLKNVLEMIGAKRAAVFPLRVARAVAFANCHPVM